MCYLKLCHYNRHKQTLCVVKTEVCKKQVFYVIVYEKRGFKIVFNVIFHLKRDFAFFLSLAILNKF